MGDTEKRFLRYVELMRIKNDYENVKNLTYESFKLELEKKIRDNHGLEKSIFVNEKDFNDIANAFKQKKLDKTLDFVFFFAKIKW